MKRRDLMTRRACLHVAAALALAGPATAAPLTIAVVSMIGDKLEIIAPQVTTGSSLDRNFRTTLEGKSGAFDVFMLDAVDQAVAAVNREISTTLIKVSPSKLYDEPERMFNGKQVGLPGAVVDELERVKAQYVLLVTKFRADVRVPFRSEFIGIGKVRGLGFYVDVENRVTMVDSRETAPGFLAPYAYFRMSLVDVRTGELRRDQVVTLMENWPVAARPEASNSWEVLSAAQKVESLERLIRKGLAEKLRPLLEGL
jgi:hypothetical protein